MKEHFVFLLLGLGLGGAYAMMTLGVVAIYRSSGVPNFAQGAIAMLSGYIYFDLEPSLGIAGAIIVTLAAAALLGIAFYILVMRQLRNSPLMARIAATIALLLLLHGIARVVYPASAVAPDGFLPTTRIRIGEYGIPLDRFLVAAIAVGLAIVLEIIARRTRFGLATRAISESEKGVILVGRSPVLLGSANWAIAAMLSALAGILLSPIAGLNSDSLTLLIIPVFAAALLARFTSYTWAVAAGLGIGAVQSMLQLHSAPGPWYTTLWEGPGRAAAFPALVVFIVMLVSGKVIPPRDEIISSRLPISLEPRYFSFGLPLMIGVGVALFSILPLNWVSALTTSVTAGIIGVSLVLLTGMGGQISLTQLGFAGVGGFVAGHAAAGGIPVVPGVIFGALAGGILGLIVGLPALRVRGQSLALITLAVGLALFNFIFINGQLLGESGYIQVGGYPAIGDWTLDRREFGVVCLLVLAAVMYFTIRVRRSRFGLQALLVRESERSAIIAGISVAKTKLGLFVLSAVIAAIGGALTVHAQLVFSEANYGVLRSLVLFVIAYIGGLGMVSGALLAGMGASGGVFSNFLATIDATAYQNIIAGGALLISLQLHPDGIAATAHEIRERRHEKAEWATRTAQAAAGARSAASDRPRAAGEEDRGDGQEHSSSTASHAR